MYAFAYERPASIEEAVGLMASDPEAKLLAGGQTLIPVLKHRLARPSRLVDLRSVPDLRGIHADDKVLAIGAMTEHAEVAASSVVRRMVPALARLAGGIGDALVRNMGTIGGSLANSDPAADYPGAIMGLGASIHTDRRKIAADEFFNGLFETALEPDEIIVRVEFPIPRRAGYVKFANPASGYVMTGAFVAQSEKGVRVAINGAGPVVFRFRPFEEALAGQFTVAALSGLEVPVEGLNRDLFATPEYRAHLAGVSVRRAVSQALDR